MPQKPVSVLTQHNDNGRTGANLNETVLKPSNVDVNGFGKLFSHRVQGRIYAQPLYVPLVSIKGKGVHNIVLVATMGNWVYAFDADDNAQPLWALQVHPNPIPAKIFKASFNDVPGTPGNIGVLSTPVIDAKIGTSKQDPSTGTVYLVAATYDPDRFQAQPQGAFQHLLYALDIADGQPRPALPNRPNPMEIRGKRCFEAPAIGPHSSVSSSGGYCGGALPTASSTFG